MGGFFGVASQQDCVFDLFLGSIITPAWEPGGLVRGQGQVWQNPRWSLGKKQTPSACPLRTSPSTIWAIRIIRSWSPEKYGMRL